MELGPPLAGGVAAPTCNQSPNTNLKSTPPPTSTPIQFSSSSAKLHLGSTHKGPTSPSEKDKAPDDPSHKGKAPATSNDQCKSHATPSSKNSKVKLRSGKKKKIISRKLDANKVAGIQTRKRSRAWNHFVKVPEDETLNEMVGYYKNTFRMLAPTQD